MDEQGNLESPWKVREKSGNLKINDYGRKSSENLFILPPHRGILLKERICSSGKL